MLQDSGTFYPFGAVVGADGKVGAYGGFNGEERPNPAEIYAILSGAFASQARDGTILAAALAANVNIPAEYQPPSNDGIRVWLGSKGYSRFIYLPYRIQKRGLFRKGFSVEVAEPIAVDVPQAWFPE